MEKLDSKWREYYQTGKYKGFFKSKEYSYKLMGKTHITFTNGEKEIFGAGKFKEEALANIFIRIDKHMQN